MGKRLLYTFMLLFGWSLVAVPTSPVNAFEVVQTQLHQRLANGAGLASLRVAGVRLRAGYLIKTFYEQRAYQPAWSDASGPASLADSLVDGLYMLEQEGLDPHDYHLSALETLLSAVRHPQLPEDAAKLAELELLLSDAFLSAAMHLAAGRLKPSDRDLDLDLANHLERALATHALTSTLHGLIPSDAGYIELRRALARYRQIAANGGWPTIASGPALKLGVESERVTTLRARLRVTGDLAPSVALTDTVDGIPLVADQNVFDEALEAAVSRFQERHGLVVDGSVGPKTRAALNVSAEARVRQVILNMDRVRLQTSSFGDRQIVVNIPNYQLDVIENGHSTMTMRVVVGKPNWQTPTFQSTMTYLVMNPYWMVPGGISQREIIPKVLQNPAYLKSQNMELLRGYGSETRVINPASIDWSTVSTRNFPYRFRQRPGSRNALGRIKFKFPNRYHVYMHDTPARSLFAKPKRAFSHGCVRLERPADLAAYLLQDNPTWTSERIDKALKRGRRQHVNLPQPIDVHLIYQTTWVGADGQVQFRPDIYGLDKKHQKVLCSVSYRQCT